MALRILLGVNYSAGENAEGDSGLIFTTRLVASLLEKDPSLHFYILVPDQHVHAWTTSLSHARVTPVPIKLQPRLHGGDFQFDPTELYRMFDFRRFDVDVLFLNQTETVPAFLQFFNRQTFHNVPAVSYVHWFDTRRPSTPKYLHHTPALLAALSGMVVSEAVACNSAFGRDLILKEAAKWFNSDVLLGLRDRLRILPPGVDVPELTARRAFLPGNLNRLLVNHRLLKYTGVRNLLTHVLPKLWSRRQDFEVLVTNPSRVRLPGQITQAPWLQVKTLARLDYIDALWATDIVVAPHRATHWSMSTLEAICAECIPVMNSESFFPEMLSPVLACLPGSIRRHVEARWFYFRQTVVRRIEDVLDNISEEREIARLVGQRAREIYDWRNWTDRWLEFFHDAERRTPPMADRNPSLLKIIHMLHERGTVSKEEILRQLHWAPKQRALAWTSFRKSLHSIASDDPNRPEAVFRLFDIEENAVEPSTSEVSCDLLERRARTEV